MAKNSETRSILMHHPLLLLQNIVSILSSVVRKRIELYDTFRGSSVEVSLSSVRQLGEGVGEGGVQILGKFVGQETFQSRDLSRVIIVIFCSR